MRQPRAGDERRMSRSRRLKQFVIGLWRSASALCPGDGNHATLTPRGTLMAKPTNRDATWHTLNPETLPAPIAKAYQTYKASYVEMKEDRNAFETLLADAISPPTGKRVVFGYNFGKLSVAIVDDDRSAKRANGSIDLGALVSHR